MKAQKHFRLYTIDQASGLIFWDTEQEWTSCDRKDAFVYEGDEVWAAELAATDEWKIEWAPEDEEMRLMGAPTLPGFGDEEVTK